MNTFSTAILPLLGLAFTCSSSPLAAQAIVTFTNGTRADADAVNANFQAVDAKATAAKTKADAAATQTSVNILSSTINTLTNAITVTAPKVQLDRRLQFPNSLISNRTIVLYEGPNNDHQFYGFGISGNTLRHHVLGPADSHVFFAGASPTTSTELMRIKGDGNVGIGISIPTAKLHVGGDVKIEGAQYLEFGAGLTKEVSAGKIGYNTFGVGYLGIVGAGTTATNRKIRFFNEGGAEFTGRVGLSTSDPIADLSINQSASLQGDQMGAGIDLRTSGTRWRIYNGFAALRFNYSGNDGLGYAPRVIISQTDGAYASVSDRRLKKDICSIDSVLDRARKVEVVHYRMIDDVATDSAPHLGVIAQDLDCLFPELVYQDQNSGYYSVNYAGLGVVALKAIQEQQVVIDGMTARHEAITAENESLRQRLEALEAAIAQLQPMTARK